MEIKAKKIFLGILPLDYLSINLVLRVGFEPHNTRLEGDVIFFFNAPSKNLINQQILLLYYDLSHIENGDRNEKDYFLGILPIKSSRHNFGVESGIRTSQNPLRRRCNLFL